MNSEMTCQVLDLAGGQIHVRLDAIDRHHDSGGVAVGMGAAGFTTYRLSRDSRPLEFFANVSRKFELANVKSGKRQFDGPAGEQSTAF
jgi:hypothetical protein